MAPEDSRADLFFKNHQRFLRKIRERNIIGTDEREKVGEHDYCKKREWFMEKRKRERGRERKRKRQTDRETERGKRETGREKLRERERVLETA